MKNKILIFTLSILLLVFLSWSILPHYLNLNKINLKFEKSLKQKDFKIIIKIWETTDSMYILKDDLINKIPEGYGENDWTIVYKDSLRCNFRHFKTNRTNDHFYKFRFFKQTNRIFCDVKIKGKNEIVSKIELVRLVE